MTCWCVGFFCCFGSFWVGFYVIFLVMLDDRHRLHILIICLVVVLGRYRYIVLNHGKLYFNASVGWDNLYR